jgi:hypothetical protein
MTFYDLVEAQKDRRYSGCISERDPVWVEKVTSACDALARELEKRRADVEG